uniref:TonB-dependent receptor n=1 Tax=Phenylobacterium glaciei TaxID=2803784 RepID=A0A974S9S1_9CAUL|nr:TonB-dependent receptor [Phenylobacterium glaciei]
MMSRGSWARPRPATAPSRPRHRGPGDQPFIPADLRTLLASRADPTAAFYPRRAFTEVGGRLSNNTYETTQLLAGLRGVLPIRDWKWDLYASYGQMDHTEHQFGNVSRAAMRTLTFAPDGGVAICGGFNIFGAGKVSPGCAAYIARDVTNATTIKQTVVEGYTTGSLIDLPAGALKFSAGGQYRKDDFDYAPDLLLRGPDIVGFNPAVPVSGDITSKEVYAELLVPVLADLPLIESLDLALGGRVADYSTTGRVSAYKADLTWKPVSGLLIRGGYQRAVRAPNIAELFSPQSLGFVGIGSPGTGTTAGIPATCAPPTEPAPAARRFAACACPRACRRRSSTPSTKPLLRWRSPAAAILTSPRRPPTASRPGRSGRRPSTGRSCAGSASAWTTTRSRWPTWWGPSGSRRSWPPASTPMGPTPGSPTPTSTASSSPAWARARSPASPRPR